MLRPVHNLGKFSFMLAYVSLSRICARSSVWICYTSHPWSTQCHIVYSYYVVGSKYPQALAMYFITAEYASDSFKNQ